MTEDNEVKYFGIFITLIMLSIVVAAILGFYYNYKHPCVKSVLVTTTCGGNWECSTWMADSNGIMQCYGYHTTSTYPCSYNECIERVP